MYEEALQHTPDHCPSLLALARLALAAGDLEGCQARCSALLQVQPDHEDAAIMLAELMFYQV
jgi:tetratricopeptide repeat protein 21B